MPTVAELDVQVNARGAEETAATIKALDGLLKDLDGDDVDIDITANAAETQAKISELIARLRELDANDVDIDIDVDAGGAAAEIAALRAELGALRDETIRIRVNDSEVRRARTSMNEFRTSAVLASRSVSGVAAAVLGLGTALIPIGAVGVGAIAALATAFGAAAIGAGLFGAVAVTVFGPVKTALNELEKAQKAYNNATTDKERDAALERTKQIMDGLDPSVRTMVQSVLDFKSAWRAFADQFQPEIFQIAQEGLDGLAGLLPSLAPIVQGAADAFLSLERSLVSSLGSPWWQSWLGQIGSVMGPILEGLGRSIGNIITGFAGLMSAFMPLTLDFVGGLENMTKSFADWAKGLEDSKQFQDFVAYIRENVPIVMAFIGSMVGALMGIIEAGAPVGEALLKIATRVFDLMTAFQENFPQAATFGIILLGILAVAIKVAGPVLALSKLFGIMGSILFTAAEGVGALAGAFGLSLGVFALILAVIALIVAGLVYAYFHFDAFRQIVDTVAKAIGDFAVAAYNGIVDGLGKAIDWLASTFGPAVATVMDFVVEQFDKVKKWASDNAATFQQAWDNIVLFVTVAVAAIVIAIQFALDLISAIWGAVWPTLSAVVQGAWEMIKGIISGALDIIMGFLLMWAGIFAGDWQAAWDGFVQMLRGFWEVIAGVVQGGFMIMIAIVSAMAAPLLAAAGLVWDGIVSAAKTAWDLVVTVVQTAWTVITTVVSAAAAGIQNAINAFWGAVLTIFQTFWNLIVAGMSAFWATLSGLVSAAWGVITGIFSAAMNGIQNAINAFWTAVVAIFTGFWALIVAGMTSFWSTLTTLTSAAWTAITALFSAALTAIQNLVTTVWTAIQNITQTVWTAITTYLQDRWTAITTLIRTAMTVIQALITTAWETIKTVIGTAMTTIHTVISAAWDAIKSLISTAMSTIKTVITDGWNTIVSAVKTALSNVVDAVRTGMSNALSAIRSGIDNMVSIVTGAAGRFLEAGASLMAALGRGIVSGIGAAVGAVKDAVGQLTSLLPGSPAKTGPLSGQGYALIRGQHLSEDLAAGITGRAGLVARASADLADLMTLNMDSGAAFNAIAAGSAVSGGGGGGITISIAPGAIILSVGDGVTAGEARQAFDGAASSLADELLTAIRRR